MRTMPRPAASARRFHGLALALATVLAACDGDDRHDGRPAPTPSAGPTTAVTVYFTRDERPAPVRRRMPRTQRPLRAAVLALLAGPTPEERASGYTSFFSPRTAGMLNAATLDRGRAIVDFRDFRRVIPNASSSAGSRMLLGELNTTLFQFPSVQSIEYRIDGSCEAFWEWLQIGGCPAVRRP